MNKYICIHGHFYQPPRENAWLEEVEIQDSAYPYHDWNERITAECYAPNTASRILDSDGRIIDIVNNYSKMSFDFGPTLLSWMERHRPDTYQDILAADRLSMKFFSGHGSAMAHAYNHMIMPLANRRDKYTQIIWGIRDFEHRFKRFPEGMWLPETAVDLLTLEILADLGILFTVLAPRQASRVKKMSQGTRWLNVSGSKIDPTMPYICRLPSGKKIDLFFYDDPISRDVAFGGLLGNGEEFAQRLVSAFSEERKHHQLVHIATDGETFGHHHHGGDMALAYCLHYIESGKQAKLTNYGEYLEKHPPVHEVEIFESSSWSCIHGIERWRDNCGCNSGTHPEWKQEWRRPLREALDELRFQAISIYEEGAGKFLKNPWKARNDYISVIIDRSGASINKFFSAHAARELENEDRIRLLKFLEMQRNAMLMYTSCGWFFDEISGIETVQIMQYASKVIQLVMELKGVSLEPDFLSSLESAPSNVYENGLKPYELFITPSKADILRVGAHYAISSAFQKYPEQIKIFCYAIKSLEHNIFENNRQKLITGKASIMNDITMEKKTVFFSVLHLGYQNTLAGVKEFIKEDVPLSMMEEAGRAFNNGEIPQVSKLIQNQFGPNIFSFIHIFRDEQRKIIRQILKMAYDGIDASCKKIYDDYHDIMDFFRAFNFPLPRPFVISVEHMINRELRETFEEEDINTERLEKLMTKIKNWPVDTDMTTAGFVASSRINSLMEKLSQEPEDVSLIKKIESILKLMSALPLELDLWKAQNIYFSIFRKLYRPVSDKEARMEVTQHKWMEAFRKLGYYLHVKIA